MSYVTPDTLAPVNDQAAATPISFAGQRAAGPGKIIEAVTTPGASVARQVLLIDQASKTTIKVGISDADSGQVVFSNLSVHRPFMLLAMEELGVYQFVAIGNRYATIDGSRPA